MGNEGLVELMLAHDAEINSTDDHKLTPLHLAVLNKRTRVVRRLLQADWVDVTARDEDGDTPIDYAQRKGYVEVLKVLRKKTENKASPA